MKNKILNKIADIELELQDLDTLLEETKCGFDLEAKKLLFALKELEHKCNYLEEENEEN